MVDFNPSRRSSDHSDKASKKKGREALPSSAGADAPSGRRREKPAEVDAPATDPWPSPQARADDEALTVASILSSPAFGRGDPLAFDAFEEADRRAGEYAPLHIQEGSSTGQVEAWSVFEEVVGKVFAEPENDPACADPYVTRAYEAVLADPHASEARRAAARTLYEHGGLNEAGEINYGVVGVYASLLARPGALSAENVPAACKVLESAAVFQGPE